MLCLTLQTFHYFPGPLILHKFSIQKYKMLRALKYSAVNVQDSAPYMLHLAQQMCSKVKVWFAWI